MVFENMSVSHMVLEHQEEYSALTKCVFLRHL